jgi:FkbH-like protein
MPVFDAAALADVVGATAWDSGRYWYVAKLPFAPACVPLYCERLVRLIAAMLGKSKRVLVFDLDNTLWGGVIGDDGVEGIELGSGTPRGEAFHAIQKMALQYKERGVILCIASKNTEEIALDAIARHPEMLLSRDDFAMFQINWDDKASNLKALADALDLGLEAFVFVDDNPVERKQVRDVLALVSVPELPEDPSAWLPVFQAAAYFEQVGFSAEDRARTAYYQGNARRSVQARTVGDPAKFLESLQMTLAVAPFDAVGRTRIAQLIAKSNQFNLTTRRYSEAEVAALQVAPDVETLQIRLRDLFGDNGMISVVICRRHATHWDIDTWIMSCRVLGRGVEQAVLNLLVARAQAAGAAELRGHYRPTAKNALVKDHYLKLGFAPAATEAGGATSWRLLLADFVPHQVPIALDERPAQS